MQNSPVFGVAQRHLINARNYLHVTHTCSVNNTYVLYKTVSSRSKNVSENRNTRSLIKRVDQVLNRFLVYK